MFSDEIKLIDMLGKNVTIENVNISKVKNVMIGRFRFNNKKIITYIIGKNLSRNITKFDGKIIALIEMKEDNEERIVVSDTDIHASYVEITGILHNFENLRNSKFRCLYEKSAGAVVYKIINGEPYYLLVYSKRNFAGFPKGKVEFGEIDESTAVREIYEEVGLRVKLKPNFKSSIEYIVHGTPIKKKVIFFLAEIDDNQEVNIDINEINKYEFVTYEQAKFVLNDSLINVLNEAKNYIENTFGK